MTKKRKRTLYRKRHRCRRGHDVRKPENRKVRVSGYIQCRQCERDCDKRRRKLMKERKE